MPTSSSPIGDDETDEDIFRALPQSAFSVHVARPSRRLAYNVAEQSHVRRFLARLAAG
jgi:trehalose 6-phosphate synthase/phosphatase